MTTDADTDYTNEPVCPHCGDTFDGAWELDFYVDQADVCCGSCGQDFRCERHVDVSYSTSKVEP